MPCHARPHNTTLLPTPANVSCFLLYSFVKQNTFSRVIQARVGFNGHRPGSLHNTCSHQRCVSSTISSLTVQMKFHGESARSDVRHGSAAHVQYSPACLIATNVSLSLSLSVVCRIIVTFPGLRRFMGSVHLISFVPD